MSELSALADVMTERKRQIQVEAWTPEHDDHHEHGELAAAGAAYAFSAWYAQHPDLCRDWPPQWEDDILNALWPWDREWWKPKDCRRDLVRAAALILAEIERIDRRSAAIKETAK